MYDKIDYIRDDYEYYLTRAVDYCNTYLLKDKKLQNKFEIGIIENLFQYKSEKAFKKYLENKLKNVEFIETENQIILVTYKERLNNFNKYNDTELFKEIKKYYNNQNARKDIIVSYRKIKPTMENMPKELMRIDFKIYAESYMINIIAVSKDGEVSMIKQ